MAEIAQSDARDVMLSIYKSHGERIDNDQDRQSAFNTLVATLKEGFGWTKADFTRSMKLEMVKLITAETKGAVAWRELTLKSLDISILSFFPVKLIIPSQGDIAIQMAVKAEKKERPEPEDAPKKPKREIQEVDRSIFETAPAPKWELSEEMDALLGYRK